MTTKKKIRKKSRRARKAKPSKVRVKFRPRRVSGWTADRILDLRDRLGLTQEQFSQELGVTYVSVNRWENGKSTPRGLSLRALELLDGKAA